MEDEVVLSEGSVCCALLRQVLREQASSIPHGSMQKLLCFAAAVLAPAPYDLVCRNVHLGVFPITGNYSTKKR